MRQRKNEDLHSYYVRCIEHYKKTGDIKYGKGNPPTPDKKTGILQAYVFCLEKRKNKAFWEDFWLFCKVGLFVFIIIIHVGSACMRHG